MKILIAPDKFKSSLSSWEVANAIADGIRQRSSDHRITIMPLADGGEGTAAVLGKHTSAFMISKVVEDPLARPVDATYWISGDGTTAFIEVAEASGLWRLTESERNPMQTSTFGTGQLIADAISRGTRKIVIGIGGTATNDAGTGIAAALGVKFIDAEGKILSPVGHNLRYVDYVDVENFLIGVTEFTVLCDVKNPLHGTSGAAYAYGPQKGAKPYELKLLDEGLRNFERVFRKQFSVESDFPGAGAGGGVGAVMKNLFHANFFSGSDYINETIGLHDLVKNTDLVFTGEGKLDHQTLSGKVVNSVSALCRKYNKPCVVVSGQNELTTEELYHLGVSQLIVLTERASILQCLATPARIIQEAVADTAFKL